MRCSWCLSMYVRMYVCMYVCMFLETNLESLTIWQTFQKICMSVVPLKVIQMPYLQIFYNQWSVIQIGPLNFRILKIYKTFANAAFLWNVRNHVTLRKYSTSFGFMAITNEPLELSMWNFCAEKPASLSHLHLASHILWIRLHITFIYISLSSTAVIIFFFICS
jgi:hypothetical protein